MNNSTVKKLTLAMILCAGTTLSAAANDSFTENLSLKSEGLSQFKVDTGAGSLVIVGDEDADVISVKAEIFGFERDEYTLTLETRDGRAELIAHGDTHRSGDRGIDLVVTVPATLPLDVHDGSGSVTISRLNADLTVDDGSGSLEISDITGKVDIRDGSGSLKVHTITGPLFIDDGSGSIEVITVTGDVEIDDNSGGIEVITVTGNLSVEDGSGGIEIKDVSGNVSVEDGSGDISVNGAKRFTLRRDGSGDVDLENVAEIASR